MKLSRNQIKFIVLLLAVGVITATVLLTTQTSNELPSEYEVYNLRVAGEGEAVRLSTTLDASDNRTIPVTADEIEISYFILSEDNTSIFIRDESRNGEWKISVSFADNDGIESGISWMSKDIGIGESVILPTGEKVILLGFNFEGNPIFNVIG